MNKRGQGLSTTAIILIVLGVLILVFLIIGFALGWTKIIPWISPPNNIQDITDKCAMACSTNSKYDFCTSRRDVKVENEITLQPTVYDLDTKKQEPAEVGGKPLEITIGKKFKATCYELSTFITQLGLEKCSAIDCDISEEVYDSKDFAKLACVKKIDEAAKTGVTFDPSTLELTYIEGDIQKKGKCIDTDILKL